MQDGEFGPFPVEQAPYLTDPSIIDKALQGSYLDGLSVGRNIMYLDTGEDQILFDTGLGAPNGGQLLSELESMGVMREDITKVWHSLQLTAARGGGLACCCKLRRQRAGPDASLRGCLLQCDTCLLAAVALHRA